MGRGRLLVASALACISGTGWAQPVTIEKGDAVVSGDLLPVPDQTTPERQNRDDDIIVRGALSPNSGATGSKTDTPLIALPQTVTVIDNEELTRRNVQSINQALGYVAGVTPNLRGNIVTRYDELRVRGFTPGVYLDGMRLLGGVYSTPQVDFHLVESVDVIKGPASVLYGNAPPGGLVNLTSKTPYAEPGGRVEIAVGNYALLRSSIDINQPLDADARWRFRVIAGAERSDGFVDFSQNERRYISPMIAFAPDARTEITLMLAYQRDPKAASFTGVPPFGSALPNPAGGPLPVDLNIAEPAYEAFDREVSSATLLFRRDLSDALTWTANARYLDVNLHYRNIYLSFGSLPGTVNTDFSRVQRGGGGSDEAFRAITIDNRIAANFVTGPFGHTLLAGIDWQNNQGRNDQQFNNFAGNAAVPGSPAIPGFDLYNPTYLASFPDFPLLQTRNFSKTDQVGVYLQDQIKWGGLNLIASGRWDWYSQFTRNRNILTSDPRAITRLEQTSFTGRLGALYEFEFGLSPFASYSESFEPQTGAARDGTPFVPVTGRQYEAGVKLQPRGTNALFTLSAYDLRRQNVPVGDPANPGFSIQVGEVTSRGIELDGRGEILPGLSVIAAGTYTDAITTLGTNPVGGGDQLAGVTGTAPLGVAEWAASGFVSYDLGKSGLAGPLGGLTIGGGVRYVGESDGTTQIVQNSVIVTDRFKSPGYVLADAVIGYDLGAVSPSLSGVTFNVNAANLFDKRHITSCFFNNACYFGASRTVVGTLRVDW